MATAWNETAHARHGDGRFADMPRGEVDLAEGALELGFLEQPAVGTGFGHPHAELAAQVGRAYWYDDRPAIAGFATREAAVRHIGAALAARGEELAGITPKDVVASWAARRAADDYPSWLAHAKERVRILQAESSALGALGNAARTPEQSTRLEELRSAAVALNAEAQQRYAVWAALERGQDPQTRAEVRRLADGYTAAVAELRPLGGQQVYAKGTAKPAAAAVDAAATVYPADWVRASAEQGTPIHARILTKTRGHHAEAAVKVTKRRVPDTLQVRVPVSSGRTPEDSSHPEMEYLDTGTLTNDGSERIYTVQFYEVDRYRGLGAGPPPGRGWEWHTPPGHSDLMGSWRRPKSRMVEAAREDVSEIVVNPRPLTVDGRDEHFAVAVHESAHRFESVVPGITAMEQDFLDRRCVDANGLEAPLQRLGKGYGKDEVARAGGFVSPYVGKVYQNREPREVLSCGTEAIFGGAYGSLIGLGGFRPDPDMRDFVLGVLATARPLN